MHINDNMDYRNVQRVRYTESMSTDTKKAPPRLVIETDVERREKLRKVAVLTGKTMRELIEEFIDSLPNPPELKC